ncbi:MAG: DoxX family protein, partial [Gemmatimonadales bacterium]
MTHSGGKMAERFEAVSAAGPWHRSPMIHDVALFLLRVVAGAMLMQHGGQKLFGFPAAAGHPFMGAPALFSRVWIAGMLETVGGLLLLLGLLTRIVGFLLAGELAVAYFTVHAPRGFFPILTMGELAVLYCFVFLFFAAAGG